MTYPNITSNSYAYNAVGSRVSASGVGGSKTFRRDGVGVTSPLLNDGTNAITPGISTRASSTTKFMHGGLKNSTAQSNSSQAVSATKQFDAFGNQLSSSGSWTGMFGYGGAYGYQTDDELKLLGNRYYDSSIGRFLTRDPIKDGRNWYSYCENNPVSYVDPDGRQLIGLAEQKPLGFWDPGGVAADRAAGRIGIGPNDCKMWVRELYIDLVPLPPNESGVWTVANNYDEWFRAHPESWMEIPVTAVRTIAGLLGVVGEFVTYLVALQPGDVICVDRGNSMGHQLIKGRDSMYYDASYSSTGPGRPGTEHYGPPDTMREPNSEYYFFRPLMPLGWRAPRAYRSGR